MYKWMLIIILMLGTPGCVYEPPISKSIPKDDSKNVAAKTSGKTVRQLASSGLFSALGRLDTRSRVRFLGAQRAGVLEQVFVELGDTVAQGQPLAKLMCATQEADQAVAAAQVRSSQARLLQLRAGARQGIQQEALELLAAAEQRATTVADEYRRRLNNKAYETTRTLERLRHESAEANALVNAARAKVADLDAGPRVVDLATREAEVAAASASLAKAEAEVGLCTVAAPVSGEVLQFAALWPGLGSGSPTCRALPQSAPQARPGQSGWPGRLYELCDDPPHQKSDTHAPDGRCFLRGISTSPERQFVVCERHDLQLLPE